MKRLLARAASPILDFSVGRGERPVGADGFRLIVHRGGVPHNTLEGVRRSCASGLADVEIDIRQAADGAWVCWHDAGLLRAAGVDRPVSRLTLPQLRALTPLTSLDELLEGLPQDARLWLDVKGWTRRDAAAGLAERLQPLTRQGRVVLLGYSEALLRAARAADPRLAVGCLTIWRRRCVERAVGLGARALLPLAIQPGLRGLIREARAAGLEVYPYTVDGGRQAARLAAWGACGVVTNR